MYHHPPNPSAKPGGIAAAHTFVQQGRRFLHYGFSFSHLGPCSQEEAIARDGVCPLQGEPCLIGREVLYQGSARFGSINWGGKAGRGGFSLCFRNTLCYLPHRLAPRTDLQSVWGHMCSELELLLNTLRLGQSVTSRLGDLLVGTFGVVEVVEERHSPSARVSEKAVLPQASCRALRSVLQSGQRLLYGWELVLE